MIATFLYNSKIETKLIFIVAYYDGWYIARDYFRTIIGLW